MLILSGARVFSMEEETQIWMSESKEKPQGMDWNWKCKYKLMIF